MQRRFPIVDILFPSGNIRDRSAKSSEIAPKSMFFGPQLFGGPQILDLVFKIAPISDHVAKFRGDRPRDRRPLWSPNSPDLNPVDYAVWDALQ